MELDSEIALAEQNVATAEQALANAAATLAAPGLPPDARETWLRVEAQAQAAYDYWTVRLDSLLAVPAGTDVLPPQAATTPNAAATVLPSQGVAIREVEVLPPLATRRPLPWGLIALGTGILLMFWRK